MEVQDLPYSRKDDFANLCTPRQDDERCRYAEAAADMAVEKMLENVGFNVRKPSDMKKLQDLRCFLERLEKLASSGVIGMVTAAGAIIAGAILIGLKAKIMGGD